VSGFTQSLVKYLHNGHRVRTDVLPPLVAKLEEILSVLSCQEAVRFYTASLLLLYEGLDPLSLEGQQLPKATGKLDQRSLRLCCQFITNTQRSSILRQEITLKRRPIHTVLFSVKIVVWKTTLYLF